MTGQAQIRHITTSFDGSMIAIAEFEHHVQTWSLDSCTRHAAFETTLDSGGNRLAISRNGEFCAVGAYHVHGIALYEAKTGTEVWRRKDLKKVQDIRISLDGERLLCGFENKSFEVLNIRNGRSKPSYRGVKKLWESPYEPVLLFDRNGRDYRLATEDNQQIATIPRQTFAALDCAFSPNKVCISESGGPITCFNVSTGEQLWQFDCGRGIHALDISYNETSQQFVAVTWPYERGGDHELVTINAESGSGECVQAITGACEFGFCHKGSLLVTSEGEIRDTATGEVVSQLEFTLCE